MKIAEVRHLDGIMGNFMVSEKEYIAPLSSLDSEVASQIIYSNLWETVSQQNYIFDTLWNKAVPAINRIREIEEGIEPIGTRLLEDPDEIFNHMKKVIGNASKRLICSSTGGMQLIYNHFFDLYKRILDKSRNGEGEGIRWITTIEKDNINLVKIFLNAGVQVRHLKSLTLMNFGVDDTYFYSTIEKMVSSTGAPSNLDITGGAWDPLFFVYKYCPNNDNPKPIPNEAICDAASDVFEKDKAFNVSTAVFLISESPTRVLLT